MLICSTVRGEQRGWLLDDAQWHSPDTGGAADAPAHLDGPQREQTGGTHDRPGLGTGVRGRLRAQVRQCDGVVSSVKDYWNFWMSYIFYKNDSFFSLFDSQMSFSFFFMCIICDLLVFECVPILDHVVNMCVKSTLRQKRETEFMLPCISEAIVQICSVWII